VTVDEGVRLTGIQGEDGAFTLETSRGVLSARKVVLAIGRRGTPRKLGVPGEELAKVAYRLIDPTQYDGKRVLVVGGGDSALEAAIMLGEESSAEVAISYRKPEFARCRPLNQQRIAALVAQGRVRTLMATEIERVNADEVTLRNGKGPVRLPNDYVIACLGGELPTAFLQSLGVSIERHDGRKAMPNPALRAEARARLKGGRQGMLLTLLGAAIVAALVYAGLDYYILPYEQRLRSPLHAAFRPSGTWGHGIGIAASLFMLLNFVYPIRKRLRIFKGRGPIAPWLTFHVFVGLLSPIVILFHSAFVWRNVLATVTYVSLLVVVATGIIGRWFYALVQVEGLRAALAAVKTRVEPVLARVRQDQPRLGAWLDRAMGAPAGDDLLAALVGLPIDSIRLRLRVRGTRSLFLDRRDYRAFRGALLEGLRARRKLALHAPLKRLLNRWRLFHIATSIVLLLVMGAHIAFSLKLGFRWILK
jgi:hypothetical protein